MEKHGIAALLAVVVWALSFTLDAHAEGKTSIVLVHGKIFTANERQPWAQAVAIEGSRIIAVGDDASLLRRANRNTNGWALGARTVSPGLNVAHVHVPIAAPGVTIDTGNFVPGPGPSLQEVLALVGAAATQVPAGTWIFGVVGEAFFANPDSNRF